jgi:hypothetical protein
MLPEDLDSSDCATFLIGEAVRRIMMHEVGGATPELKQMAWGEVMGKIVPAALTRAEFDLIDRETGLYPPTFRKEYADRFRKDE